MKNLHLILLTVLFCIGSITAQESKLDWLTDLDDAKTYSKNKKKPILMYFTGSDWCAPCKMLKEDFFYTDRFEKNAKKLVLLKVDIPRRDDIISTKQKKTNMALVRSYNKKGGFPLLVALDHRGHVLGEIANYNVLRDPSKHFSFVESILENH